MSKQVTKAIGNRYCQARLKAAKYNEKLLTRAGAVDCLPGVTEDCLKKYELDITRAPNDVVALMADAYNEPELRSWYCANECPLGKELEAIEEMPPERALLRLQNSLNKIEEPVRKLAEIMDNGKLSSDEAVELPLLREQFIECHNRLREVLAVMEKVERAGCFV